MSQITKSQLRAQVLLLVGGLLLDSPAFAQPDDICSRTGKLLIAMVFATDGNLADDLGKVRAAVNEPPGQYVTSCVQLQEQSAIQSLKYERKGQWFGFTPPEYRTLPVDLGRLHALYDDCKRSTCGQDEVISALLFAICKEQLGSSDKRCGGEQKSVSLLIKPPLPRWRKIIGGALLETGAVAIVFGSLHLAFPLFRTEGGCIEYGLVHPCVADRFGVGGPLLGAGLAAAGGGVLALTLRSRSM